MNGGMAVNECLLVVFAGVAGECERGRSQTHCPSVCRIDIRRRGSKALLSINTERTTAGNTKYVGLACKTGQDGAG